MVHFTWLAISSAAGRIVWLEGAKGAMYDKGAMNINPYPANVENRVSSK
jgi:hypothetical protein